MRFFKWIARLFKRKPKVCPWCHRMPDGRYVVLAGYRRASMVEAILADLPQHVPDPNVVEEMKRLLIDPTNYERGLKW